MRVLLGKKLKLSAIPPPKYDLRVEYVKRCHHVDFQPNRTTLGRPTLSLPKNLIESHSSLQIVGAPPARDGQPPKYNLSVVYVRRFHQSKSIFRKIGQQKSSFFPPPLGKFFL